MQNWPLKVSSGALLSAAHVSVHHFSSCCVSLALNLRELCSFFFLRYFRYLCPCLHIALRIGGLCYLCDISVISLCYLCHLALGLVFALCYLSAISVLKIATLCWGLVFVLCYLCAIYAISVLSMLSHAISVLSLCYLSDISLKSLFILLVISF